jgi:hypothetical protein
VNWVGAVTAGAASLAAVLAGVNLYVSGRRELNKWTRETLIEIFSLFLDASFKHASACRAISLESRRNPNAINCELLFSQHTLRRTEHSLG